MASRRLQLRRELLGLALALAAGRIAAQDKPPARLRRVGVLETTPRAGNQENMAELARGLKELGYAEGQNLELVYRAADGRSELFSALARELVSEKVDVIVTRGTPATLAALKTADGKIPIVTVAVADPIETRLVTSLEAPGGSVTGLTSNTTETGPKRLELLKAVAPSMKRVAGLVNLANPASAAVWRAVEAAAPGLGLEMIALDVRKPADVQALLQDAAQKGANGLFVGTETAALGTRAQIIDAAAKLRLPASYAAREFVEAGGLMSYGVSYPNLYYRAAAYIDKVLKGAKPGELAMAQPNKFELFINRKTAFQLKLAIPPDLLLRSDKVVG
jgi:putative tryptophan/tyrosine transport system substrate-binding protein